ncbi:MAG: transporter substrate-binding domain-containing protein, partial [Verrucomicrobiota bacterium]|nr:transporter substrate-binding domain-containing protein [Verrucomicrobiota bacterium]
GEFDMLQTYSQTAARDDFTDFSVPFLTLRGTIFVRKHKSPIHQLSDFNGRRFAIIGKESIGERFLSDHHLQVEAVYVSSSEEALELINDGLCTGTFLSYLTALSVIDRAHLQNVEMFGDPFTNYDIRHCFAVHKGDTLLLARLNEGLAILNRTGEFQEIYNHWFGHLESPMVSRRLVQRYGTILLAVIITGILGGWLYRRVLKKLIARQTAELSSQKALLQALYDNIPMAICLLEREAAGFRVLSANRQAEPWVGAPTRRVEGRRLSELPNQTEWLRKLAELLSAHASVRELVQEECPLPESHKQVIFTLVPMSPSPEGRGRLCVLGEDITERRTLDEEISQSRRLRAIGELVGGIAHEFNNLLTPITLKMSEIQLDWPHDHRLCAELQLISDAAQRASELTRRLLTFGHKVENRIEEVHLGS